MAWQLRIAAHGPLSASGEHVLATRLQPTPYGVRLVARSGRLPLGNELPLLQVTGLPEGRYWLTVDAGGVVEATAGQWAAGMRLSQGADFEQLDRLRNAICDKNRLFFYFLRPQNKAYIFLFRRHEPGTTLPKSPNSKRLVERKEVEIARLRLPLERDYELIREKDYQKRGCRDRSRCPTRPRS